MAVSHRSRHHQTITMENIIIDKGSLTLPKDFFTKLSKLSSPPQKHVKHSWYEHTFSVRLKNDEEMCFFVMRDDSNDILCIADNCMMQRHPINATKTQDGWANSSIRQYLNRDVFALLPDSIQSIIQPTKITQIVNGKPVESVDRLFLLSATQIYGKGEWSNNEPDDISLNLTKKMGYVFTWKRQGSISGRIPGAFIPWWTRSFNGSNFYCTSVNGCLTHSDETEAYGIPFAFHVTDNTKNTVKQLLYNLLCLS